MKYSVLDWLMPIICIGNAMLYGGDIAEGKYFTISLVGLGVTLISIYLDMYIRSKQ